MARRKSKAVYFEGELLEFLDYINMATALMEWRMRVLPDHLREQSPWGDTGRYAHLQWTGYSREAGFRDSPGVLAMDGRDLGQWLYIMLHSQMMSRSFLEFFTNKLPEKARNRNRLVQALQHATEYYIVEHRPLPHETSFFEILEVGGELYPILETVEEKEAFHSLIQEMLVSVREVLSQPEITHFIRDTMRDIQIYGVDKKAKDPLRLLEMDHFLNGLHRLESRHSRRQERLEHEGVDRLAYELRLCAEAINRVSGRPSRSLKEEDGISSFCGPDTLLAIKAMRQSPVLERERKRYTPEQLVERLYMIAARLEECGSWTAFVKEYGTTLGRAPLTNDLQILMPLEQAREMLSAANRKRYQTSAPELLGWWLDELIGAKKYARSEDAVSSRLGVV